MPLYEINVGDRGTVTVEANTEEEARGLIERDIKATATRQAAVPYLDDLLFDYETGVRGKGIRAKLARADNFRERESVAENLFGSGGFTYNSSGQMALTPEGLRVLGLKPDYVTLGDGSKLALNRIIDENSFGFTQGDLADFAGMTGPLVGALTFLTPQAKIIGGITKALKFFNGGPRLSRVLAAGSGSAVGKAGEEAFESIQGLQEQEAGELADMLKNEFVIGGTAQFLGEALGVGYGLLLGKQAPFDNLRLFRQGVQGRSLDDIMKLDKKLGREATDAEIKKAITQGTVKVYQEKALPAQAAFGRNLPGRFQGLFEQVLGNQRSEKTKAYLFREVSELYNKINKDNQLSGELAEVISGYAGRTAMSKAQKAQLDSTVQQAITKVKTAEIDTVKKLETYLNDVVEEFADVSLESSRMADPLIGEKIIADLAEVRKGIFQNMRTKYQNADARLRQSSTGNIMPVINEQVISPMLKRARDKLDDFKGDRLIDYDDVGVGEQVAFKDNPYQYFKKKVEKIEDLKNNNKLNLTSLRNTVSNMKEEASLYLESSDGNSLAKQMIDIFESSLDELADPGIGARLVKGGLFGDDVNIVNQAGTLLRDSNKYAADVLRAYDSALINKITLESKKGAYNANQVYKSAVRGGSSDDLNDIFKATKDYDDYIDSIAKKGAPKSNKLGDLRNTLKQKLMSDAFEESFDAGTGVIDFSKFATFLSRFDKKGVDRGKLQALLGDEMDAFKFMDVLSQVNKLKPNIKASEMRGLIANFRAQAKDQKFGLGTETSGRKFLEGLEELAEAKSKAQALEGNLIVSKLPEATTEEVVSKIFTPQGASNIRLVKETVGDEAFTEIQNNAMNKMLQRAIDFDGMAKGGDISKIFQADKFENILRSYGDETLEAMFGQDVAQGLNNLARTIQATTAKEVGRGGSPGTLVAAAIAINSFNPAIWPTIGGMAVLRSAFQNPFFLKMMARTDKSAAVQLIEVFERMLRIGGIQELTRATGTAIEDLEDAALEQVQATDVDKETQNEINNIIRETEGRLRARPAIELPDVARVPIVEPNLPGIEQKSVLEREQELGFKPII